MSVSPRASVFRPPRVPGPRRPLLPVRPMVGQAITCTSSASHSASATRGESRRPWSARVKMVQRHHHGPGRYLRTHVFHVAHHVGTTPLASPRLDILGAQSRPFGDAAMHFQRGGMVATTTAHVRRQIPAETALDVAEFFRSRVSAPKPASVTTYIGQLHRRHGGGNDAVAAVRDVGEWAAMHQRRRMPSSVCTRLGAQRLLQQHHHGRRCGL